MESLEWKQRKDALVNQFGSKKKKAAIRFVVVVAAFSIKNNLTYVRITSAQYTHD